MEFDLTHEHADLAYKLLTTVVTPRPIALVTTVSANGTVNAAPFSFFNVFGSEPPIVALAPGDRSPGIPKDTAANIRNNGEFVVHIVDPPIAEKMVACASSLPADESELPLAGFT
ncbi:MAG: flavin reductase family protein, partial [Verrucomicrobiales bacterium]|nr:flavin reductase family protein [Verrucomicrobiales bacterium]